MIARGASIPPHIFILSTAVFGCSGLWAAGGAHEHGAAELFLSAEGKALSITFNLPAHSAVGFETAAVSAEQRAAVERAQTILMAPSDLFVIEGNSCELIDAVVDVSSIVSIGKTQSQPEVHADHEDEHAQASDVQDKEQHSHHDEDDTASTDSHSDVSAAYTFNCESDDALTQITFGPDELPFSLEQVDVFWVADWGQGAGQAVPQNLRVDLRN
jgi:hypothetical protein